MSKRTYYPDRADLIELTFNPAAGREIDKRRPAIVLVPLLTTGNPACAWPSPSPPTSHPARSGFPCPKATSSAQA